MASDKEELSIADKDSFLMIVDLLNEMGIRYWIEGDGALMYLLVNKQGPIET